MNADSRIQLDFGTRTISMTVAEVRRWQTGEDVNGLCERIRFKRTPAAQRAALELVRDVARQTPGCVAFKCEWCGARTYGAEGVIGSSACDACDELAGLDNEVNDSGEPMPESTRARVAELLASITAAGGDARRALVTCDFLKD